MRATFSTATAFAQITHTEREGEKTHYQAGFGLFTLYGATNTIPPPPADRPSLPAAGLGRSGPYPGKSWNPAPVSSFTALLLRRKYVSAVR